MTSAGDRSGDPALSAPVSQTASASASVAKTEVSFPLAWPAGGRQGSAPERRVAGGAGWLSPASFLLALIIAVPILGVLLSLGADPGPALGHVSRTVLPEMIGNSLLLAVGTGIGVTVLGVSSAWLVTMCRFPGRGFFEWALVLPLAVPAYVLAYAYTDFLQHSGAVQTALRDLTGWGPRDYWFPEVRSLPGAILLFSFCFYPYVYLLARTAFLQQSVHMWEAARSLGATPGAAFFRVALPMARPAVAAGLALALMETLADFGAVAHFGVPTLTTGIYRVWFALGEPVLASQMAAGLLCLMMVLLLFERWNRGQARYHDMRGRFRSVDRFTLGPVAGALAALACAVPTVVGFGLPAVLLIYLSVTAGHEMFGARYWGLTLNSMTLAGLSALAATLAAIVIAYAVRLRPGWASGATARIAGLGYALPGTVIAVGILVPLATLDRWIDGAAESVFGVSTGLLLTGSIAALIYAYLVRFLSVSQQSAEAALARVTPNMDAAARALGARPIQALWRVHVPILSAGLASGGLIVFVEVMKELPATLILRPFNFDTLAIQAYVLASDERLAEASTASIVIVAVGLLPVLLLTRTLTGSVGRGGERP